MTQIIFGILFVAIIVSGIVWGICNRQRRPQRKGDLQRYWNAFNEPYPCPDVLACYIDGMHISLIYGVPLEEVGCPDPEAFRQAAIGSLERTIAVETDNDAAIRLRADLTRLKLMHATPAEREAATKRFITVA